MIGYETQLEGGMLVKMKTGERRRLICSPTNNIVHHRQSTITFGLTEIDSEQDFRERADQVISRQTYNRR